MLSIFNSKEKTIFNTSLKMADELVQKLHWVPNTRNGMDKIVEFFEITSPYQDELKKMLEEASKKIYFKDAKKKKFFDAFKKFIDNTGRDSCGWNRTEVGERPTPTSTFINMRIPYDEMFTTRNVSTHLSRRNNPKNEIDSFLKEDARGKLNECEVVEKDFVNPFMKKNYNYLIEILKEYKG